MKITKFLRKLLKLISISNRIEYSRDFGYMNASKAVLTYVDNEDKAFVMLNIADSQNRNVLAGQTKTVVIKKRRIPRLYCNTVWGFTLSSTWTFHFFCLLALSHMQKSFTICIFLRKNYAY